LTDWSGSFTSDNGPPVPLVVRLKVDMKPETRMSIPELVVPVVVDANVGRALMVAPGEIR
jgi:hypothetical protein